MSGISLESIDLTDYGLYRDGFPHNVFTFLRRHAPVWKHPDTDVLREGGAKPFWVLSRHADLRSVNRDTETFTAFDGAQIRDSDEARKGNRDAAWQLGDLYREAARGVKFSPKQAFRWYAESALAGSPTGQNNVGAAYENGLGCKQNYA